MSQERSENSIFRSMFTQTFGEQRSDHRNRSESDWPKRRSECFRCTSWSNTNSSCCRLSGPIGALTRRTASFRPNELRRLLNECASIQWIESATSSDSTGNFEFDQNKVLCVKQNSTLGNRNRTKTRLLSKDTTEFDPRKCHDGGLQFQPETVQIAWRTAKSA